MLLMLFPVIQTSKYLIFFFSAMSRGGDIAEKKKILHNAEFISITGIGRERHCVLKQNGFTELQKWIDYFDKFWDTKLKKLEAILQQKSKP